MKSKSRNSIDTLHVQGIFSEDEHILLGWFEASGSGRQHASGADIAKTSHACSNITHPRRQQHFRLFSLVFEQKDLNMTKNQRLFNVTTPSVKESSPVRTSVRNKQANWAKEGRKYQIVKYSELWEQELLPLLSVRTCLFIFQTLHRNPAYTEGKPFQNVLGRSTEPFLLQRNYATVLHLHVHIRQKRV